MTKPIKSYPEDEREAVIRRRIRQAGEKGTNGMGVLSALDLNEKRNKKDKK